MSYHIHQGDALAVLREMPSESVDCCITSPPYYNLRDYGVADQIGLEPTPDAYIARLVEVFREVRRVLRAEGTLWVNIGDSYAGGNGKQSAGNSAKSTLTTGSKKGAWAPGSVVCEFERPPIGPGLKPKDLIGIPWLLAFALRNDGWWLRSEIIWDKKAPMPESVKDRPTRSHEHIFLLSKAQRYYYDTDAIAEPCGGHNGSSFTAGKTHDARSHLSAVGKGDRLERETRNKRDVWRLSPGACKEAHFATFPLELPETCLRAGCPEGGVVLDPFSGAGTTGLACLKNGRRYVGIELNADYIAIAYNRARRHYPLLLMGNTFGGDTKSSVAVAESRSL